MTEGQPAPLPRVIPDARFNLPTDAGPVWSSGTLVAGEGGIWLLNPKDALAAEAVVQSPPQVPGRLGALSFAVPRAMITRITHDRLVGFFIDMAGKKLPLRLDVAGWKALDEACDAMGIAHS